MKFNHNKFEELAQIFSIENNKISIFLPTDRVGDGQAAKIHFKNQLSEVVDKLMDSEIQENPMSKNEALKYLADAYALLDNEEFWRHQSDGLAVFISEDMFEHYAMPIDFKAFNYVGGVFYLKPMLPAISKQGRFFILALSQNEVRFFEGEKHSISPVIIEDLVPESMAESMAAIDIEYPATLQSHSGGSGNAPIFHGQGGEKDGKTDRIMDYFRMIDNGLMEMLHDENAPLIIAGVDYLIPMYKSISNYSNIVEPHISGNVENDDPVLLHEKAWSALAPIMKTDFNNQYEKFKESLPADKASVSVNDIAPAALNGKVETLFLDNSTSVFWGTYQEDTNTIIPQEKQNKTNACLINFAAIATYLQGGEVFTTSREEMPHVVSPLNAIYRY